ncbi:MAG: hypothetical protein GC190_04695 [Alphaproteobacteria bacterium]|nr:hypothetical protein [Alphaproteobacteria bacterium]
MSRWARYLVAPLLLLITSCGSQDAPTGRWEGFIDSPTWIIVVRLEVESGNNIRASALSANVDGMTLPNKFAAARQLKTAIREQWPNAVRGRIDFHGNTLTRTDHVAPLFVFDEQKRTMTFYFYAGGKLAEKVVCLPVERFAS